MRDGVRIVAPSIAIGVVAALAIGSCVWIARTDPIDVAGTGEATAAAREGNVAVRGAASSGSTRTLDPEADAAPGARDRPGPTRRAPARPRIHAHADGAQGERATEPAAPGLERGEPAPAAGASVSPGDVRSSRRGAPADAVVVDAAADVRCWARVVRVPTGLDGEPGAIAGLLVLRLDRPASRDLVFRMGTDPPQAIVARGDGDVRIARGAMSLPVALRARARGTIDVTFAAVEGAETATGPVRARFDATSIDDLAEPEIRVVVAPPDTSTPGALASGDARIRGLAGTVAGSIRVLRSGFRGFATEATDVVVGVDDPDRVLGPVPAFVSIPPGAVEPAMPLRVTLRSSTGRAHLVFRAGSRTQTVVVDAEAGGWSGVPARVVLPRGARATLRFRRDPATRIPAPIDAVASDRQRVRVAARPESNGVFEERARLDIVALDTGETSITLASVGRPDVRIDVLVVEAEVVVAARADVASAPGATSEAARRVFVSRPRSNGDDSESAPELVLSVEPPSRLVAEQVGAGASGADAGGASVVVRLRSASAADGAAPLPVRIEGSPRTLRVEPRGGDPARVPYEVDLDATAD